MKWRDDVIVPKYHKAGVKKIAWVWPGAAPGNEPAGGKDKIENRYFSTEAQALAWVAS
jgi:hypothetical protein